MSGSFAHKEIENRNEINWTVLNFLFLVFQSVFRVWFQFVVISVFLSVLSSVPSRALAMDTFEFIHNFSTHVPELLISV